jgi:hypothetical protein
MPDLSKPTPPEGSMHSRDTGHAMADPPHRVLLCLGPCHGEFYLPLDRDERQVCPNDGEHPVAIYGLVGVNPGGTGA